MTNKVQTNKNDLDKYLRENYDTHLSWHPTDVRKSSQIIV